MDEVSDAGAAPLHILNLAQEILRLIFEEFREVGAHPDGQVDWVPQGCGNWYRVESEARKQQTIQNARLVCRAFNAFASPLLCSILRVGISRASIDAAVQLTGNPLIASGIRGICLLLDYRSAELAHNINLFCNYWKGEFGRIELQCVSGILQCQGLLENSSLVIEEEEEQPAIERYARCLGELNSICKAWDEYISTKFSLSEKQDVQMFQTLLSRAFQEYGRMHAEQLQMITDGSFSRLVASLFAQVRRPVSLVLTDGSDKVRPYGVEIATIMNKETLFKAMVRPQSWKALDQAVVNNIIITPSVLLSEIPLAIRDAGGSILKFSLGCFPRSREHSAIYPPSLSDNSNVLNNFLGNLEVIGQGLRAFDFGVLGLFDMETGPEGVPGTENHDYIDRYLKSMTGGHHLECLGLAMQMHCWGGSLRRDVHYPIGRVLEGISSYSLRKVCLSSVMLTQAELENFCRRLSSRTDWIRFAHVKLWQGIWANVLDILREKLAFQCAKLSCRVWFNDLSGGEFKNENQISHFEANEHNLAVSATSSFDSAIGDPEDTEISFRVMRSQEYVLGLEYPNPLLDI